MQPEENKMSTKPTLVVLAAGMGSRYGGLKQIDPVGPKGEVVLDYSVYDAIQAGFGDVVFIIRKDIEKDFREVMEPHFEGRIPIRYAFQGLEDLPEGFSLPEGRTKPWGTGHAMLVAREQVSGPFAVLNADDFYGRSAFQQIHDKLVELDGQPGKNCMVGFELPKTLSEFGAVSRGICATDDNGYLKQIQECHQVERLEDGSYSATFEGEPKELNGSEVVSMNFWGYNPDVFDRLETSFKKFLSNLDNPEKGEFYIPILMDEMINEGWGSCEVMSSQDQWMGVTFPDDKPAVQAGIRALIEQGIYPESLWG